MQVVRLHCKYLPDKTLMFFQSSSVEIYAVNPPPNFNSPDVLLLIAALYRFLYYNRKKTTIADLKDSGISGLRLRHLYIYWLIAPPLNQYY